MSQIQSPARDQVFKHMSQWGTFYFKQWPNYPGWSLNLKKKKSNSCVCLICVCLVAVGVVLGYCARCQSTTFQNGFSPSSAGSQHSLVGQVRLPTELSYRGSPAPLKTGPLATHRASSVGHESHYKISSIHKMQAHTPKGVTGMFWCLLLSL